MKKKRYLLIGDLHQDFRPVRELCKRNPQLFEDENIQNVLIILGDFGGNVFFDYRDKNFKTKLGKYPFEYFVVRGNHEERPTVCMKKNPDEWHRETYANNIVYVENEYPYIKYATEMPNYYIFNQYQVFTFPGAFSVDKYYRLERELFWFEGEQMTEEEREIGLELLERFNNKCDLVLSHTCPVIFEPTDLFLPMIDQSMVDKTTERYLGQIEYKLDYRAWAFGHFHAYRDYPRTDGRRKLMLFNDCAVELEDYMESEVPTRL
jgi:3-oxoacid CoA-transferase subunit A